jgi:replicative DNA helicase
MLDLISTKLPPQNTDIEQELLCSILLQSADITEISDILKPEDFYKSSHQMIFKSMVLLSLKKINIDLVSVANKLKNLEELESIGGPAYLSKLVDNVPVALNALHYAEEIKKYSMRREIIQRAYEIAELAQEGCENVIETCQRKILDIEDPGSKDKFYTMSQLADEGLDRIEKINSEKQEKGYRIGFSNFDKLCNIIGSKLIIVAGRPGHGKTSFLLTVSRTFARNKIKTGILSIEMDKEQLHDRSLASISEINTMKLVSYKGIKKDEWDHVNRSSERLSKLPIIIDDTGSVTIDDVERKCRKMVKLGCKVIFIDQLSKIKGSRGKSEFEKYTHNVNRIADLKKELRIPIFLLSQLNRELEKRPAKDREPKMSDLKQTGALEEDADIIFFIYRPEKYETDPKKAKLIKGQTVINMAKHRQGATFRDPGIMFIEQTTTFQDGWIERVHI